MGLGCFVDVDGLVGTGRFETCPYYRVARGLGTGLGNGVVYGFWIPACAGMTAVERASPAKIASLFRAPFALRKGRDPWPRGLGTGLGKGVVYGFWVPASAGMTGLLVGVGVYYAVESGGAFVDPFGGVGEEEFYAEV